MSKDRSFSKPAALNPGTLLILVTLFSLVLSNLSIGEGYRHLWHYNIGFTTSTVSLHLSLLHWINDGLMALFFLMVGLEIRREISEGELSTRKKAMLPVFAAVGGMLVPALIYTVFNFRGVAHNGWGIPMATDIAFALAVLSMLKNEIPGSIRVFLTALAIIDDLGAVLVIAFFYTSQLYFEYLGAAAIIMVILMAMNKYKVTAWWPFILAGIILWYCILKSGIHATIAGVLLAMFIPMQQDNKKSMLHKLEHFLAPLSHYVILPLFAIANTALLIDTSLMSRLLTPPALGIFFGLLIGKPFGITLFTWLSVKLRQADLPRHVNYKHVLGAGLLGGIGFTMSIFISMLAFKAEALQDIAKVAILLTSVIAGISGLLWMKYAGRRKSLIVKKS